MIVLIFTTEAMRGIILAHYLFSAIDD